MSDFADAYIERIKYLRAQPNKFQFNDDGTLDMIPKDEENMKLLLEFEKQRVEKIIERTREQIAKDIEAGVVSDDTSEHYKLALPILRATFAAIARGEVEK